MQEWQRQKGSKGKVFAVRPRPVPGLSLRGGCTPGNSRRVAAVSYTHLDVYKRQAQDHHINIRRVGAAQRGVGIWREKDMDSIDGLCTDDPGVTLVIYCADCVPLYFVDREHRAIGLAHAGWRGTAAGMAQAMVERMAQELSLIHI